MRRRGLAALLASAALAVSLACGGGNSAVTATSETPAATSQPQRILPPQPATLLLEVTSPADNLVVSSGKVTIEGRTSPDAVLSVDGTLVRPGLFGEFSYEFSPTGTGNPSSIEVIASSVAGENVSAVRTAVFTGPGVEPPGDSGIFGTVVEVTAGSLTLETSAGRQSLVVSGETVARIPGRRAATPQDILPGSAVAVLADGGTAVSVLVQTTQPYQTRHFTGLVADRSEGQSDTVIYDGENLLSVDSGPPSLLPSPGDLVTLVLKQHLPSGDLFANSIEPADDSMARLETSMDFHLAAGALEQLLNLETRLARNTNRNLSLLFQAMRSSHSPAKAGAGAAFNRVRRNHKALLSKLGNRVPTVEVAGIVSSIDSASGREIVVETSASGPVTIGLAADTPIEFLGKDLTFSQLDLASRVTVRFDAQSAMAQWVHVHPGNVLATGVAAQVASSANLGEAQGAMLEFNEKDGSLSVVLKTLDDRGTLKLESRVGAEKPAVLRDGIPSEAVSHLVGSEALALYEPESLALLELDVVSRPGTNVSGVVQSFIPKVLPGNMVVRETGGGAEFYNHTKDTIVRRNGKRVSINEVRVGDIVRPNTRYELDGTERVLTILSLKTPADAVVAGFIRGVTEDGDGNPRISIVTAWLDILTLKVPPSAALTSRRQAMDARDLAVGQEVGSGFYNPVSRLVTSLDIN